MAYIRTKSFKKLKTLFRKGKISCLGDTDFDFFFKDVSLSELRSFWDKHQAESKWHSVHLSILNDGEKTLKFWDAAPFVDWLISRYGGDEKLSNLFPDNKRKLEKEEEKRKEREERRKEREEREEREEGEERKKETEEVSESWLEDEDSETHGGDGNSGEVDALAETEAAEDRENLESQQGGEAGDNDEDSVNADDCQESNQQDGSDSSDDNRSDDEAVDETSSTAQKDGQNCSEANIEEAPEEGEPADVDDGEGQDGANKTDGDNQGAGDTASLSSEAPAAIAQAADGDTDKNEQLTDDSESDKWEELLGGNSEASQNNNNQSGGYYAYPQEWENKALKDVTRGRKFFREVEKIMKAMDIAGTEESPRISGKRLVNEIVSKRCNLSKTRREEKSTGVFLFLPDVSGSCSAVCNDTMAACWAIQQANPEQVIVLPHSNGFLDPHYSEYVTGFAEKNLVEIYHELENKYSIAGAIAFGDWDAIGEYKYIDENSNGLIWLDSYCCNYTTAERKSLKNAENCDWSNTQYFIGVNSIETAITAIKRAQKGFNGRKL